MVTENKRMFQRRRTAAQWTSENPVLGAGEIGVISDTDPPEFKIGDGTTAWNSLESWPELVAEDPSEVDIDIAGSVATLSLLDTVGRSPLHRVGQYYSNYVHALSGSQTMTQDRLMFQQIILSKGVIDRIGVEVTTAVASLIVRLGIYTDDNGLPLSLIAEASSTADASTTGVKDLTISATIPQNGRYWLAAVSQAAAGGALRSASTTPPQFPPFPCGTSAPSGANSYTARRQDSVTGALPSTVGTLINPASNYQHLIHYRYSSTGP